MSDQHFIGDLIACGAGKQIREILTHLSCEKAQEILNGVAPGERTDYWYLLAESYGTYRRSKTA